MESRSAAAAACAGPALSRRAFAGRGAAWVAATLLPPGQARACEYFSPHLRIVHPWTRASAPGATIAALFMTFDEVVQADRLIGAETPVAENVQMAGQPGPISLEFAAGGETVLSDAGPHLSLLGLRHPLEIARSYPLRLVFERGGTVLATINVDYGRFR